MIDEEGQRLEDIGEEKREDQPPIEESQTQDNEDGTKADNAATAEEEDGGVAVDQGENKNEGESGEGERSQEGKEGDDTLTPLENIDNTDVTETSDPEGEIQSILFNSIQLSSIQFNFPLFPPFPVLGEGIIVPYNNPFFMF